MVSQTEVKVNFATNTVTVIKTETFDLFTDKGIYGIEGDSTGFSHIEKRSSKHFQFKNYVEKHGKLEICSSRPINQTQVREIVKENEKFKREPKLY